MYQLVMVLGGSINFETAVYGWFLYGLPFLGMAVVQKSFNLKTLDRITLLFELCLVPNLFFAVMQTFVGNAKFFSAGFGEGLKSANGVQRATGTFSSPAGYALYLSLTAAFLLIRNDLKRLPVYRILLSFGLLLCQVPISGSRIAIFSVFLVFLVRIVFRKGRKTWHSHSQKSKLVILIALVSLFGAFWKLSGSSVFQATAVRFVSANQADPPLKRLMTQLKIDFQSIGILHGTGLGSRANGTTVFRVDWVEFDPQRIVLEAGLIVGLILLGLRIFLVVRIVENYSKKTHSLDLPLIAAVLPPVTFGQFMGQGTISIGTWLGLYVLEYLRPQFDFQFQHQNKSGLRK